MVPPLRFKGDKAKDAGVKKKKKKSKPTKLSEEKTNAILDAIGEDRPLGPKLNRGQSTPVKDDGGNPEGSDDGGSLEKPQQLASKSADEDESAAEEPLAKVDADPPWFSRLTEAQKAHERHKMRQQKAKAEKEGVKTHRQKVEEYNAYLSRLSEHNDMPRIGPG